MTEAPEAYPKCRAGTRGRATKEKSSESSRKRAGIVQFYRGRYTPSVIASLDPPGVPLSLPYRPGRARDVAFALVGATGLTLGLAVWYNQRVHDVRWPFVAAGLALSWPLVLLPFALVRWRRHVRLDEEGVTLMRPRGRVRAELRWEEVEAYGRIGVDGLELRGAGRAIRITDDYERAGEAWRHVRFHCHSRILGGLRERLARGEVSELRVPASRLGAHLGYAGVTLAWAASTAFFLWFRREGMLLTALFGIAFWSWIFLQVRRDLAWRGGSVRVEPEGLVLKRLDARWQVSWSDVASLRNGVLERRSGRAIRLHPGLLNLEALERLVATRSPEGPARPGP